MFIPQQQISGLCQLSEEIYHLDVLLMVLFVMEPESWCLVEWWSMGNIPMNYMNYKLADGNGND